MNVARCALMVGSAFAVVSLVVACSSSSTSGSGSSGDGGGGGGGGEGGGGGGGGGEGGGGGGGGGSCKLADGTYTIHSTAQDMADGGFGCSAPPDQTVTYPLDASSDIDAGGSSSCTTMADSASCTTTIACTSMQGSISSKNTTVTKINADGKGYTVTIHLEVTSMGMLSTDCVITSTATPQ